MHGCAISPDDRLIASVSADNTIRVWSASEGRCLSTLHVDAVLEDCVWTSDGQRVVVAGAAGVYFMTLSGDRDPVLKPGGAAG